MIQIGICDDNLNLQEKYQEMVKKIAQKHEIGYETVLFCDGKEVIQYVEKKEKELNILLLDILMKEMSGIETAAELRRQKSGVVILFLTSSEEYKVATMDIKPQAYLVKDQLTIEEFEEALLGAINFMKEKEKKVYILKNTEANVRIPLSDISFVEGDKNLWNIYLWDGTIIVDEHFRMLEFLGNIDFYQVNPQYLIGLAYVQKIEKNQIVISDRKHSIIPVSESCLKKFKNVFTEYMIRQM